MISRMHSSASSRLLSTGVDISGGRECGEQIRERLKLTAKFEKFAGSAIAWKKTVWLVVVPHCSPTLRGKIPRRNSPRPRCPINFRQMGEDDENPGSHDRDGRAR